MATTETTGLPPLPENEKTYAGIPEAVFVVSDSSPYRKCVVANLKIKFKGRREERMNKKKSQKMCHTIRRHNSHFTAFVNESEKLIIS